MENRVQDIEKTVLKLDLRMDSMVKAMEKMAISVEHLASMNNRLNLIEERCDARNKACEDKLVVLHKRVDGTKQDCVENDLDLRRDIEKLQSGFNKGLWLIVSIIILSVVKLIVVGAK